MVGGYLGVYRLIWAYMGSYRVIDRVIWGQVGLLTALYGVM